MTRDAASLLPLKPSHFHVLLSLLEGQAHGYEIRRRVMDRTDGRISLAAGTLYHMLDRLVATSVIEEAPTPSEWEDEASSRWRFYAITSLGRETVSLEIERLEGDLKFARMAVERTCP